jgi:hypothetical protein
MLHCVAVPVFFVLTSLSFREMVQLSCTELRQFCVQLLEVQFLSQTTQVLMIVLKTVDTNETVVFFTFFFCFQPMCRVRSEAPN